MFSHVKILNLLPLVRGRAVAPAPAPEDELDEVDELDQLPPLSDFELVPNGHLVVSGGPGRGKTRIIAAMAEAACPDMDVYVADPWLAHSDAGAVRPSAVAGQASNLPDIVDLIEQVRDIAAARALAGGEVTPGRPLLLVIEEAWYVLHGGDNWWGEDVVLGRKRAAEALRQILAHAEAAAVTVLLSASDSARGVCLDLFDGDVAALDLGANSVGAGVTGYYSVYLDKTAFCVGRRQGVYQRPGQTPELVNIPAVPAQAAVQVSKR